jgi:hypothetical protein
MISIFLDGAKEQPGFHVDMFLSFTRERHLAIDYRQGATRPSHCGGRGLHRSEGFGRSAQGDWSNPG